MKIKFFFFLIPNAGENRHQIKLKQQRNTCLHANVIFINPIKISKQKKAKQNIYNKIFKNLFQTGAAVAFLLIYGIFILFYFFSC